MQKASCVLKSERKQARNRVKRHGKKKEGATSSARATHKRHRLQAGMASGARGETNVPAVAGRRLRPHATPFVPVDARCPEGGRITGDRRAAIVPIQTQERVKKRHPLYSLGHAPSPSIIQKIPQWD